MKLVIAATLAALGLLAGWPGTAQAHESIEPGTMNVEFLLPPMPAEDLDAFFGDDFGIYADGERCLSFRFTDPGWTDYPDHAGNVVVVGREDQPEPCRSDGATLTFGDGVDRWLLITGVLELGTTFVIENYAPTPPSTGPRPPAVGSLGLTGRTRQPASWIPTVAATAAIALLLVAARRTTANRSQTER